VISVIPAYGTTVGNIQVIGDNRIENRSDVPTTTIYIRSVSDSADVFIRMNLIHSLTRNLTHDVDDHDMCGDDYDTWVDDRDDLFVNNDDCMAVAIHVTYLDTLKNMTTNKVLNVKFSSGIRDEVLERILKKPFRLKPISYPSDIQYMRNKNPLTDMDYLFDVGLQGFFV